MLQPPVTRQFPELLRLTLERWGRLGECLGHWDGQPVYVFGGIPGEEVLAQTVRRRHPLVARVFQVLKPSPHRMSPPCPYFWPCTGCEWQHVSYSHQLEVKRQLVVEALKAAPELGDVSIPTTVPSPLEYGYRNHARFTIGPGGSLGFVNRVTREYIPIARCLLMHQGINEALAALQGRCQETTQLSIRHGVNTGELLIQPSLKNPRVTLATGQPAYAEDLLGHRLRVASPSFFQVNTRQTEQMVQLLRQRLELTGTELLVDAYAGVGTFSVLLSPYVRKVIAIEESTSAIKDALINTKGISGVELRQGKTEEALSQLDERPDIVILDPPRTGCHPKALKALGQLMPRQIVYVSCDLETLTRDLRLLAQGPFAVEEVQPLDMFPQTHHVECLATLSLKSSHKRREPPDIILASTSPRRQELLKALDLPFHLVAPQVREELEDSHPPEALAQELALRKARSVAASLTSGIVLGADTLVVLEGRALGKPATAEEARATLLALRGREHQVVTGLAVLDAQSGRWAAKSTVSRVTMRPYSEREVEAYIASGEPLDKAGAYGVQDASFQPAAQVEGCYLNVVGLPLCTLVAMLRELGLEVALKGGWMPPAQCTSCPLGRESGAGPHGESR